MNAIEDNLYMKMQKTYNESERERERDSYQFLKSLNFSNNSFEFASNFKVRKTSKNI